LAILEVYSQIGITKSEPIAKAKKDVAALDAGRDDFVRRISAAALRLSLGGNSQEEIGNKKKKNKEQFFH
jgi:hypothetical protein